MAKKRKAKAKPGPEADRLKIDGDWREAMKKAVKKKKPKDWPQKVSDN